MIFVESIMAGVKPQEDENSIMLAPIKQSTDIVVASNNSSGIVWSVDHEKILVEWADKAMCYRWLHAKSNKRYSRLNARYTIPVIVISTLTGTANFAQDRVPLQWQSAFVMLIGACNLIAGIISTIQQFLKITQLNEAHRVSSIAWDKFYRNIKIEMAKHPSERTDVSHMLKSSKEEFDRLMETSPIIPDIILAKFKTSFSGLDDFSKIQKPEICDVLIPTNYCRNQWYTDDNIAKEKLKVQQCYDDSKKLLEKINADNISEVEKFSQKFFQLNGRYPIESEYIDNLSLIIDIPTLKNIIASISTTDGYIIANGDDDDSNV